MSKYDPLKEKLLAAHGAELPMRFDEIERVLGFALPASARQYPAWWSNNVGTHVGARAWREAGWKTSRVDLGSEKVVFVRERIASGTQTRATSTRPMRDMLSPTALALLDAKTRAGLDEDTAIAQLLNELTTERRRRLIERFAAASPDLRGVAQDSTSIIREDRDGR
jgi:hypothetical protein